jgi:hypothetical protein
MIGILSTLLEFLEVTESSIENRRSRAGMEGSLKIVPARPSSSDGLELPWDVGTGCVAATIAPGGGWIADDPLLTLCCKVDVGLYIVPLTELGVGPAELGV